MSTNEPMIQERLDAIKKREAKATVGPWGIDGPAQCGPGDSLAVYPVEDGGTVAYVQPSWDDAEFISRAREDIPALLAEVERLRDELAKARAVTEDKVERAKRAFGAATAVTSSIPLGMSEHAFIQGVAIQHGYAIRIALQTALGGGDDA